jgi:ureidoglycolate lyase
MRELTPEPLTKTAFAAFGDVVETDGAAPIEINQGFARRCNALANIDVTAGGAAVNISLFDARPRPQPIAIRLMERHPLGSQLFMPLQDRPWLVVVCTNPYDLSSYRAFTASGRQGVNYARNVWHHPLLVLGEGERFLVVDRIGQDNLEEVWLDQPMSLMMA